MTKQEEKEIQQGLKEISEGKVVPLSLIEKRQEIMAVTAQAIRLGICAYQHLGFDNLEMYNKIANAVHEAQSRKGLVIKVPLPYTMTGDTPLTAFEPLI